MLSVMHSRGGSMLLFQIIIVISVLVTVMSTPEDCKNVANRLRITESILGKFEIQDGSSLAACSTNGPQCCSPLIIQRFTTSIDNFVNTDALGLAATGFANAEQAVDHLRNERDAIITDITENIVRPLLLSAASPPTDKFIAAVDTAINEIKAALNGRNVDLKRTLYNYVKAAAGDRIIEALESFTVFGVPVFLTFNGTTQKECAMERAFDQIFSDYDAAAELVGLLQNVSAAMEVIKQFPAIFDELLVNVKQFKLSRTCVDVLISNFLCPMCANQPPMCPGRCNEIFIGCLSPLNQAVEQLDASLRLISSIIKGLAGSSGRVTDYANLNRIPKLYDTLSGVLNNLNFVQIRLVRNVIGTCKVRYGFHARRGRNVHHKIPYKRSVTIPEVQINEALFDSLERQFSSVGGDKLSSVLEEFCSPISSIPVSGSDIKLIKEDGICSYGVGNVGTYNSTFTKRDVIDQVHDNPAGYYNYNELIGQAKEQTYVLTSLFSKVNALESVLSVFLPNETFPTTTFQDLQVQKLERYGITFFCYPTPSKDDYSTQPPLKFSTNYICYPRH